MAVTAQPDAEHVTLAGVTDPAADGNLVFSPSTHRARRSWPRVSTPPPAGYEYRCWVEVDGSRQRIGKMFFAGGPRLLGRPGAGDLGRVDGRDLRRVTGRRSAPPVETDPVLLGEL